MMNHMTPGMDTYFSFWLPAILLVVLLLVVTLAWLIARWLNHQRLPAAHSTSQPQDSYKGYEEGYQAQEQTPDTYKEGEERYPFPVLQDEQSQAQYPQEMPSLHVHPGV